MDTYQMKPPVDLAWECSEERPHLGQWLAYCEEGVVLNANCRTMKAIVIPDPGATYL